MGAVRSLENPVPARLARLLLSPPWSHQSVGHHRFAPTDATKRTGWTRNRRNLDIRQHTRACRRATAASGLPPPNVHQAAAVTNVVHHTTAASSRAPPLLSCMRAHRIIYTFTTSSQLPTIGHTRQAKAEAAAATTRPPYASRPLHHTRSPQIIHNIAMRYS